MFYYKEVIKLIAESINFHVDTIMFKLFKNVSLACNPLYRICRISNAKRKTTCYSKLKSQLLVLDSVALPWLFVCYKANNQIFILEKSNDVGGTWRENRYPELRVMFNHICTLCLLHLKLTGQNVMQKLLKFSIISKI